MYFGCTLGVPTKAVTLKVSQDVLKLVEEMVRLGLANSRNHGFNILIKFGLEKATELIERKKKVLELVEKFSREGLPYDRLPTSADVERGRGR